MKWLDLVKQLLPLVLSNVPHAEKVTPFILTGIEQAEQLKDSKSGPERLQHSVEITNTLIDAHNSVSTHQIDKAGVDSAIGNGISTAISIANLISKKQ